MSNPMILVGNRLDAARRFSDSSDPNQLPRLDYLEFAKRLEGELFGYDIADSVWYELVRMVEDKIKIDILEAVLAYLRMKKHSIVLSTSEKMAIPLAALAQMGDRAIPHVVIGHKLSSGKKVPFFETWKLYKSFTHLICVSRSQVDYGIRELGIPERKIDFLYDKVDHDFFRPEGNGLGNYILAVGIEKRDYETLLKAISGSHLDLRIVASSRWTHQNINHKRLGDAKVYHNLPYTELKTLYAGARLVVVPLFDADYAAGVNTLLEAMAMGKTTVVSQSTGIIDYIVDEDTGIFVPPEDSEAMRQAILETWYSPKTLQRIGRNARSFVEDTANIDNYVEGVCGIVERYLDD